MRPEPERPGRFVLETWIGLLAPVESGTTLQSPRLIHLQPARLHAPAVIRLFGDTALTAGCRGHNLAAVSSEVVTNESAIRSRKLESAFGCSPKLDLR
jgi:hypothetical protein